VSFLSIWLLRRIDVALKVDADRGSRSTLAGLAPPNTVVVLLQFGDVGIAGISIFDLACPSVKLLRPATGASELFWPALLTALLFGPDCAGGFCAEAELAANAVAAANNEIQTKIDGVFMVSKE